MYSKVIQGSYLYLPKHEIEDISRLRRQLTVRSKFGDSNPIPMYDERGKWFGVPRYFFHPREITASDFNDQLGCGEYIDMTFTGKLFPAQQHLFSQFVVAVQRGQTGFIFEGPAGSGKTVQALAMVSYLNRTALVVVPRSNLIDQWIERILQFTNLPRSAIGIAKDGKVSANGKKLVVGLVHTIALDRFGGDFKKMFGCVVFDEVDRSVPPETFAPVVGMFPVKYRIGMSATLDRLDGLHVIFEHHIGECFLRGKGKERMRPTIIIRKFEGTSGYVHAASGKMNRRGMLISRLSRNTVRNAMIAKYAAMIAKSGRQCLVLSDRKEQLITIKDLLVNRFKMGEMDIGFYVDSIPIPKSSRNEKQRYRKVSKTQLTAASTCNVIMGTFGKSALGTDIPSLSGLVFATPQSDVRQSVGRIERFLHDKKEPVVVDIVDMHYQDAVRWFDKRIKYYRSKGLEVKVYA